MESTGNVLIVEDEQDWCAIYERAARRQGIATVKTANDLAAAESLLDMMKFDVAFVDIGLDVEDDRNIDGLRVMDKIRTLGDETSIIVVTGRTGMDVLPITRDAIKKYGAFDTIGKVPIEPDDIARLLIDGLAAYEKATSSSRKGVQSTFRGNADEMQWDDQILRVTEISGGARGLYEFLERLFGKFLPAAPRVANEPLRIDSARSMAHGEYWSRAKGKAVAVLFGRSGEIAEVMATAKHGGPILDRYDVGEILKEASAGQVRGVVYALKVASRYDFS